MQGDRGRERLRSQRAQRIACKIVAFVTRDTTLCRNGTHHVIGRNTLRRGERIRKTIVQPSSVLGDPHPQCALSQRKRQVRPGGGRRRRCARQCAPHHVQLLPAPQQQRDGVVLVAMRRPTYGTHTQGLSSVRDSVT
jgi:hypothetical protein